MPVAGALRDRCVSGQGLRVHGFKHARAIGDTPGMPPTRTSGPTSKNQRPSRAVIAVLSLAIAIALALSTTTGCMVLDEMDSAAAKMPSSKKAKAEKATKAPDKPGSSAAGQLAASKAKVLEASRQWWKQAKTINNGEAPEGIVSCKLPEGMKFMSKDDCVVQGGRPGDASS